MIIFNKNWGLSVYEMDDLPGYSVANHHHVHDEMGAFWRNWNTGKKKRNSKTDFRGDFSGFKRNDYLLRKLEHRIFRETMVTLMSTCTYVHKKTSTVRT